MTTSATGDGTLAAVPYFAVVADARREKYGAPVFLLVLYCNDRRLRVYGVREEALEKYRACEKQLVQALHDRDDSTCSLREELTRTKYVSHPDYVNPLLFIASWARWSRARLSEAEHEARTAIADLAEARTRLRTLQKAHFADAQPSRCAFPSLDGFRSDIVRRGWG